MLEFEGKVALITGAGGYIGGETAVMLAKQGAKIAVCDINEATIEKTYPNIFIVKYDDNDRNVTYSYTDVLTRTVEVDVFNGTEYSPLLPPVDSKQK